MQHRVNDSVTAEVPETSDRLVLRPSPSTPRARRQLIEAGVLGVVLVAVLAVMEVFAGSALGWIFIGFCVVWYGLLPLLYFRNACLYVGGGRVGAANMFGRRREADVSRVAGLKVVGSGRRARKIVIEGVAGEQLLAVYATAWRTSQVDELRRALGM